MTSCLLVQGASERTRLIDGQWVPAGMLERNNSDQNRDFGIVLDMHDDTAMVLSLSHPSITGEVLVYDLGCSPCPADFNGDWVLDSNDAQLFVSLFSDGDASADIYSDGELDFFDVSAFLTAFAAGCP